MKDYTVKYEVFGKEYTIVLKGNSEQEIRTNIAMWTNWDKIISITLKEKQ